MPELSQAKDKLATCQTACLDALDTCVICAGFASPECYRNYSECGAECDRIERLEGFKRVRSITPGAGRP